MTNKISCIIKIMHTLREMSSKGLHILQEYKIIILVIVLSIIIILVYVFYNRETFKDHPLGSMSGFGYQKSIKDYPLFNALYPPELGSDFKLNSVIRTLKMNNLNPSLLNGFERSILVDGTQFNIGASKCPIFIVPTIGASNIYATWSLDSSRGVKTLDSYQNFENSEKWKCKTSQDTWVPIWPPTSVDGLPEYCWTDNIKLTDKFNNADGVNTKVSPVGTLEFIRGYDTIIKGLTALGYVPGSTLFGVNYDFRTITKTIDNLCVSLTNAIEKYVIMNKKRAIIMGHGLGSCVANYFLVSKSQEWKDAYIESFITISGAFGGCPKALRVLLSGESLPSKEDSIVFRNATSTFSGLYWLLPNPVVYGPRTLITMDSNTYRAADALPNDQENALNTITGDRYKLVQDVINKSMQAPNVLTYVIGGSNHHTESSYEYKNLKEEPKKIMYSYNTANYNSTGEFPDGYNGDGTMPQFALEYPLQWQQYQSIHFKFYQDAEHLKILSLYEPVQDILKIIKEFNAL